MRISTMGGHETIRLCMGWTFEDDSKGSPILSHLFGEMVQRSTFVVHHYHGDLFHDAEWLRSYVTGPTEFYWMVRFNGTNIGDSAITMEGISSGEPRVLYHVALAREERHGTWTATFTEVVRVENPKY